MIIGTEKDYWDHPYINRSLLLTLRDSPRLYKAAVEKKLEGRTSSGFHMGSMVDVKVLTPDLFPEQYILRPDDMKTPSSSKNQQEFVEHIREGHGVVEAYEASYLVKGKSEAVIRASADALHKELTPYLNFLSDSEGKIEYTEKDAYIMAQIEMSLANHPIARPLINHRCGASQVAITSELMGINFKALLDHLIIDHDAGLVTQTDLKTTGKSLSRFHWEYRKWEYHLQQAFYKAVLMKHLKEEGIDYPIRTICIVGETIGLHEVRVYDIPDIVLNEGMRQIVNVINRYKWHKDNDEWTMTREEYEADGLLTMRFDQ